jgi:hypothetical protein
MPQPIVTERRELFYESGARKLCAARKNILLVNP